MGHRQAVLVVLALLVAGARTPLAAQAVPQRSAETLDRWVKAVSEHTPGRPDESIRDVVGMTYTARREMYPAYVLFLRELRGDTRGTHTQVERAVTDLAGRVRRNPGTETFLKRAAVLNADAVVFRSRFPAMRDDAPPPALPPPPPLLSNGRVTVTRDGEVLGQTMADWNLPFARSLLDELLNPPGDVRASRDDEAFVGAWYHAVAAYLFARGMNGDANKHLQQAAHVLPDDPRVLFDRGTYAETFGLSIYQAVEDPRIPSEDKTNAEVERLYRRAADIDPAYAEARVRLARVLDRLGRHDEAAAEVTKALDLHPSGVAGFYAHIVAGRIATARGQYDEALRQYQQASALFAGAQSALLGASHAALLLADVPQAVSPIAQLVAATREPDPWLDYHLGAGRDVNALLAVLWGRVAQ
jgi:tetratricopeptide (TPR) repeat protein